MSVAGSTAPSNILYSLLAGASHSARFPPAPFHYGSTPPFNLCYAQAESKQAGSDKSAPATGDFFVGCVRFVKGFASGGFLLLRGGVVRFADSVRVPLRFTLTYVCFAHKPTNSATPPPLTSYNRKTTGATARGKLPKTQGGNFNSYAIKITPLIFFRKFRFFSAKTLDFPCFL